MSCLGEMLRTFRANRKLSLQDVANAASLSKAHVWELESGRVVNPTIDTLCKLGAALDMDPELLCQASLADHGIVAR